MPAARCLGWVYAAAAAVLVAGGCADETSPRKDRPADRARTQYAGDPANGTLPTRVAQALAEDPATAAALRVRVDGGHVRFSGFVDAAAKWRAQEIARGVSGVETVENRAIVRRGVAASRLLAQTWIHST